MCCHAQIGCWAGVTAFQGIFCQNQRNTFVRRNQKIALHDNLLSFIWAITRKYISEQLGLMDARGQGRGGS